MKNDKLLVSEIFNSIDGEGIRTGELVTFVRLYGCNLRCKYCDSMYAVDNKEEKTKCKWMTINEIIQNVERNKVSNKITLTGGEPLLHKELSLQLIDSFLLKGYEVNIETNGSIDITPYLKKNVIITMDWKSYYSQEYSKMQGTNLEKLRKCDVLKFVVANLEDLEQMKDIVLCTDLKCNLFVSPVFNKINPSDIVNYLMDNKLSMVRMQLQMHKFIWDPEMRGV